MKFGIILGATILFTVWLVSGCVQSGPQPQPVSTPQPAPPSKQELVLTRLGYKNIQLSAASVWACSKDDSWVNSNDFTADGPNGPISGTVCCGWMKGCTVRY